MKNNENHGDEDEIGGSFLSEAPKSSAKSIAVIYKCMHVKTVSTVR